jgi:predicted GNAT family N-acyltransferase
MPKYLTLLTHSSSWFATSQVLPLGVEVTFLYMDCPYCFLDNEIKETEVGWTDEKNTHAYIRLHNSGVENSPRYILGEVTVVSVVSGTE